jgi:hypothetical protein
VGALVAVEGVALYLNMLGVLRIEPPSSGVMTL